MKTRRLIIIKRVIPDKIKLHQKVYSIRVFRREDFVCLENKLHSGGLDLM